MNQMVETNFGTFIPDVVEQTLRQPTEIWYMNCTGWNEKAENIDWKPTLADLKKTHVFLGTTRETDFERIYAMMQGESWSPKGEANSFIEGKDLQHTSMSAGDVIKIGDKAWIVAWCGFEEIT